MKHSYTYEEVSADTLGKCIVIFPGTHGANNFGKVERVGQNCTLYGTWGDFPVVPGKDRFEICGADALTRDKYICFW